MPDEIDNHSNGCDPGSGFRSNDATGLKIVASALMAGEGVMGFRAALAVRVEWLESPQ